MLIKLHSLTHFLFFFCKPPDFSGLIGSVYHKFVTSITWRRRMEEEALEGKTDTEERQETR